MLGGASLDAVGDALYEQGVRGPRGGKLGHRSVRNFLDLYRPLADWWEVMDNTVGDRVLLAAGCQDDFDVETQEAWDAFERSAEHE